MKTVLKKTSGMEDGMDGMENTIGARKSGIRESGVRKLKAGTLDSRTGSSWAGRPHAGKMATPLATLTLAAVAALAGCSSSSSPKPEVVSIAMTDINGTVLSTPLTMLTVNTGVYLDVTLSNDTSSLGADWTVACGSAPAPGTPLPPGQTVSTACGTFTPVHTLSAPVPSYVSQGAGYVTLYTAPASPPQGGIVTLYAAATADPSRFASLAFPILGLPISVGFAPQAPATLAVNGTTPLKAVVSNDYTPKGVTWSVVCGSSACGSFSPTQTASGVATTYTAPASAPAGGTVTVSATSVTDPTKSVSATITIAPVAISLVPATLSVAVNGTGVLNATVTNDLTNAGVDWSLVCGAAGPCGTITAHTASGTASTYTAPANVPTGGTVTVTATSTADPTAMATAVVTVTSTATPSVSGQARAGQVPIVGASVWLYAAGEEGYGSSATLLNDKTAVTSDGEGRFTVLSDAPCASADSLLYVVANGGNGGGGDNPNLVLMAALGPCNRIASDRIPIVLNEVTTVTAAVALSAFLRDAAHVGAPLSNRAGLSGAVATANEIADIATGEARALTPTGGATVPREQIDTLANVLHSCAATSAGKAGDGTACGELFSRVGVTAPTDTLQAALSIARASARSSSTAAQLDAAAQIFGRSEDDGPFTPSLSAAPDDWLLRLTYSNSAEAMQSQATIEPPMMNEKPDTTMVDASGNGWHLNRDGTVTETVGAMAPRVP